MNKQSRSYRQVRSSVLVEVANLEWEQAVTVLASALNERAVEGGFQAKVELVPLWSTKGPYCCIDSTCIPKRQGDMKLTGPACSFCGVKEEDCKNLIENEDRTRYICDQCVKVLMAYLKANPGRKHLRYLPKRNQK